MSNSKRVSKKSKNTAKSLRLAKALARRFRDRNRRFIKLDRQQQRIKIIKDAITSLRTEKTKAVTGKYLRVTKYAQNISEEDLVHEVLEKSACHVCAIGSAFTSAVQLKNKLKVKDLVVYDATDLRHFGANDEKLREYLGPWFTRRQLSIIEIAFEKADVRGVGSEYGITTFETLVVRARNFGRKYKSSKDRLLAIYENMLEHNGKFVP